MSMGRSVEIICSGCGADTLVRCEPVYEGFKKTGEQFICTACGHVYADESEVPYKVARKVEVFTEADRPDAVEVFGDDEKQRCCRYCRHYTVNPFAQRCGLHNRFIDATDYCDDFDPEADGAGKPR